MDTGIMQFLASPIINGILYALGIIAIIAIFGFLFYIGSDKKKKHLYTGIKNLSPEIKNLFDANIQLPENVQFFPYGVKDSRNNIITHIFMIVLVCCLIIPFAGILLGNLLSPPLVVITLFILCGLIVYWRYRMYTGHRKSVKANTYRYGLFILRDLLVIRMEGASDCIILSKNQIKEIEECKLWTSDSSEDDGIKISTGSGASIEELVISGEFFNANSEKVIDAIKKWRYIIPI